MSSISNKLRTAKGVGTKMLMHWCPGCEETHGIFIENSNGPCWQFNGDYEAPTFSPSVHIFITHTTDDDDKPLPSPVQETLCHYFINGGKIQFCGDSPHKLSGQTVDLPNWPYARGEYGGIEE